MSSISEMQAKVNEQRRINSELNSELSAIVSGLQSVHHKWNNLCNSISSSLNEGVKRVSASQGSIDAAYEMQGDIDRMYVLFKNIEMANKKIRECNNKKIYDFANYSAVRKIVAAMLDNVELALVSDATIVKAVERKHLQMPDYWLTCALLSIMAWRNDDRALANQALERACKLEKKETAVFFLAFNLRMNREAAALKWFEYYQTCDLSGEDDRTFLLLFSIVNKAVTQNCSDTLVVRVQDFIRQVIDDDMKRSGYDSEFVLSRIAGYLHRFVPGDALDYTLLMKHCTERDYLAQELMLAKANVGIYDFILKTAHVTDKERHDYINSFIEGVVKKPNAVELEVEDEIRYNELIIYHQGDIAKADEAFAQIKTHRENEFDIIVEMIDWIYQPSKDDVNPMVRANMLSVTGDFNRQAVERHAQAYRSAFKTTFGIKINDYETAANLKDESGECAKLRSFVEEKKNGLLSGVKTWIAFVSFGVALLALIGAFAIPMLPLLTLTVAGVAYGIIHLLVCKAKKASIIRDCDNEYAVDEGILKGMVGEFDAYCREYAEYDGYLDKITAELETA